MRKLSDGRVRRMSGELRALLGKQCADTVLAQRSA